MVNGRAPWPCLLLPAAFAFVWFLPALWHGFRSDDFLVVYYFDRAAEVVRWDRVIEEFARPWFGVRDLYRPLVSLSYGLNLLLSPGPFGFHLGNVVLLAVTATCTAALAALHSPASPRLAGLVAGAAVVVHPASVEPSVWIAARTSGLQVACAAAAMWAFARHLRGSGARWPYVLCAALALASKEGAVMLPVSLWMLDLLHRVGRTWRERWRLHGPVLLSVAGYLVLRRVLLGWFTTAESPGFAERCHGLGLSAGFLAVPPLADGAQWWWMLLPVAAVVLAVMDRWPARPLLFLVWGLALLLPTSHLVATPAAFAGRFVYDAVPVAGLLLAMGCAAGARGAAALAAHAAAAFVLAYGAAGSWQWQQRFAAEDATLQTAAQRVLAAAAASGPGRPFGIAGLPGLPLLQTKLWGVLGLRPFAAVERPLVGMPEILAFDSAAPLLLCDAAPVHALAELGAGAAIWQQQNSALVRVERPAAAGAAIELVRVARAPGAFAAAGPLLATGAARVQVVVPHPAGSIRLQLLDDLPANYSFGVRTVTGPACTEAWFDLTRALAPLVLGGLCTGVAIEVDGAPAPPGTVVRAYASLPGDALPAPLLGRVVPRAELAAALAPPRADLPLRLYLLLPTGLLAVAVAPGEPLQIDPATMGQLVFAADVLGGCLLHWFWQTPPEHVGAPWRSPIDWCELR